MNENTESGTAPLIRLTDPTTGTTALVAIEPAVLPGSPLRFYRGRPPGPGQPR